MASPPTYPENSGFPGIAGLNTADSDFNSQSFLVKKLLGQVSTATLVKVVAVSNAGGLAAVGFVDVLPLVNQIDGSGNAVPHGVIHHLPYFRLQGGTDAIILDPKINDVGIALFASHDISTVKSTKKQANPGSRRRFDMADGIYFGGVLNGVPAQYVQFTTAGINITSPTKVTLTAPEVHFEGNVTSTGTFMNNSKNIGSTHVHSGVTTGGATTGVPT